MRSKKGAVAEDVLQYIPRILFLAIAIFSIVFLVRSYIVNSLDVKDVQAEVFMNRILYSPDGISYFDSDLQRIIPGTIDVTKFTDDTLNKLMDYKDDSFIAAKLELSDAANKKIAMASYNGKTFERWLPLRGETGPGGVKSTIRTYYVNYVQNKMTNQGILKIEMLQQGS